MVMHLQLNERWISVVAHENSQYQANQSNSWDED
jgi:hypothetical protein